ncbi:MAG: hypothetical protein ACPGWR_14735 [Ardenticatenaceae bacterium]
MKATIIKRGYTVAVAFAFAALVTVSAGFAPQAIAGLIDQADGEVIHLAGDTESSPST